MVAAFIKTTNGVHGEHTLENVLRSLVLIADIGVIIIKSLSTERVSIQ